MAEHLASPADDRTLDRVSRGGGAWVALAALLAIFGSFAFAVAAASVADVEAERSRQVFEQNAREVALTLRLALRSEENLIISTAGFLLSEPSATNAEFNDWTRAVRATERYPELLGMGEVVIVPAAELPAFIALLPPEMLPPGTPFQVFPAGDRPLYCLLRYSAAIDPSIVVPAGADFCAIGTGLGPLAIRDSGVSGYQVASLGDDTLLTVTAPFYAGGTVPASIAARRAAFEGWIGISVDPKIVFDTALQSQTEMVVALVYHAGEEDAVEFRSGEVPADQQSLAIDVGNGWTVQTFAPKASVGIFANGAALALLLTGVAGSVLLAALVLVLGTTRARALLLVAQRTGQLRHQSLHDALTDLPNRALIVDRLGQLLARTRRNGTSSAALFIDLDDFKNVNDTLGHQTGDRLLIAVANRLQSALRDVDTIGRMGGDEFVVLIDGDQLSVSPQLVAERLLGVMRQPFEIEGCLAPLMINTSIGIAVSDNHSGDDLLRDADVALYQAKAAGKNCYRVFQPEMRSQIGRRLELEIDLRSAIEREQFRLAYQPIYNLEDVSLVGVEALLRWHHPTLGLIEPDEFIPILEHNGQILDVGRWVLNTACEQMVRWHALGHTLDLSINVSGRQLDHDSIIDHIAGALDASGLAPTSLIIEVTETTLMHNAAATALRLAAIKQLGVRIAVDDFGTGYSSLAYLQQFPVDCLKIDRQFTSAITSSPESRALISTLVQLGRDLGLQTLAEGIETEEQMNSLRFEQVDQAQGFLLSRPLDPSSLEALMLAPHRAHSAHPD